MAQLRKIIHVEMRRPVGGRTNFYFGSKAAIFQHFSTEQIGVTYKTLRNHGSFKDNPYCNDKCIIRQGELITSKSDTNTDDSDE